MFDIAGQKREVAPRAPLKRTPQDNGSERAELGDVAGNRNQARRDSTKPAISEPGDIHEQQGRPGRRSSDADDHAVRSSRFNQARMGLHRNGKRNHNRFPFFCLRIDQKTVDHFLTSTIDILR